MVNIEEDTAIWDKELQQSHILVTKLDMLQELATITYTIHLRIKIGTPAVA